MIHLRTLGINILKNAEKIIFISAQYKKYTYDLEEIKYRVLWTNGKESVQIWNKQK